MASCKSCGKHIKTGKSYCSSCSSPVPSGYEKALHDDTQVDDDSKEYRQAFRKIDNSEAENIPNSTHKPTSQSQNTKQSGEDHDNNRVLVDGSKSLWWPIVTFGIGVIVHGMGVPRGSTISFISILWFVILVFKKL